MHTGALTSADEPGANGGAYIHTRMYTNIHTCIYTRTHTGAPTSADEPGANGGAWQDGKYTLMCYSGSNELGDVFITKDTTWDQVCVCVRVMHVHMYVHMIICYEFGIHS